MCQTAALLGLLSFWGYAAGTTWYVDGGVSSSGDGTTWESAFKKIQEGIDAAESGDEVIVAQGTYIENIQFRGKNIVLGSTDPLDPNMVANTIIDGDQAGSVVIFSGTENETCVLSGFTIRNGIGEELPYERAGGGICGGTWENRTHATIQNNVITGNSADEGGGLAYCHGTVQQNTVTGNSVTGNGGGLLYCDGVIQNNVITANSIIRTGPFPPGYGYGGGLNLCYGTIQNNVIAGNSAGEVGGGLANCGVRILNNTVVGNRARYGGGLNTSVRDEVIRNCIIWGNTAEEKGDQIYGSNTPSFSCIQDWSGGGERNISGDPRFVDPGGGIYRLSLDSPCIDAGQNEAWMSDAVDLDGNPRIFYGRSSLTVDMGAYEYGSFHFKIVGVVQAADGGVDLRWGSRPDVVYMVWSCHDLLTATWEKEIAIVSSETTASWTDTAAVGRMKFYRVEMKQ